MDMRRPPLWEQCRGQSPKHETCPLRSQNAALGATLCSIENKDEVLGRLSAKEK